MIRDAFKAVTHHAQGFWRGRDKFGNPNPKPPKLTKAEKRKKRNDKLTKLPMSLGKKLKQMVNKAGDLLNSLKALNVADLAAAIGPAVNNVMTAAKTAAPALAVASAVGVSVLTGAAILNEREDDRQVDRVEIAALQDQLDELDAGTISSTEASAIQNQNDTLAEKVDTLTEQINVLAESETVTELAERQNTTDRVIQEITSQLPGLASSDDVDAIINRIPAPVVATPTTVLDISEIENEVSDIRSDVDNNQQAIAELDSNLDELQQTVEQLPDAAALRSFVDQLQAQISDVEDGAPTVEEVNALESAQQELQRAQASTDTQVQEMRSIVDGLPPPADLTGLETSISELVKFRESAEQIISELDATIVSLEEVTVADLQAVDATIMDQATALEIAVAELESAGGFDASDLEAVDAANAAAAAAAQAQAAVVAAELASTEALLDSIAEVFFADVIEAWTVGIEVGLVTQNGCDSKNAFVFSGQFGLGANGDDGTTKEFCADFVAVAPAMPSSCSIDSPISLLWRHNGAAIEEFFGTTSGPDPSTMTFGVRGQAPTTVLTLNPGDGYNDTSAGEVNVTPPADLNQWGQSVAFRVEADLHFVSGTRSTSQVYAETYGAPTASATATVSCSAG